MSNSLSFFYIIISGDSMRKIVVLIILLVLIIINVACDKKKNNKSVKEGKGDLIIEYTSSPQELANTMYYIRIYDNKKVSDRIRITKVKICLILGFVNLLQRYALFSERPNVFGLFAKSTCQSSLTLMKLRGDFVYLYT